MENQGPLQGQYRLQSLWLNALSPGNAIIATVTNIFLTVMVQSPSYGLKPAIMGPSIFAADLRHTYSLFTPEPEQMSCPVLPRLANMDEGATWRLNDPHFHTSGERLVQLELMKHTIRRHNSPPHTIHGTKAAHAEDNERNACSETHVNL